MNSDSRTHFQIGDVKAAEKLHRFFGKLLRELVHLEATELEVVEHGADLQCCMRRGDDVLKTIPIAGYWLKPIEYWLKRRYNHVAAHRGGSGRACYAQIDSEVLFFQVSKGTGAVLRLYQLTNGTEADLLSAMHVMPYARDLLRDLLTKSHGLLVSAAPADATLEATTPLLLSLTGGIDCGRASDVQSWDQLAALSESNLVVVELHAEDAIQAIFHLLQAGADLSAIELAGVLCQAVLQRVCNRCARETQLDQEQLSNLPAALRPLDQSGYRVGRGCQHCNQTGYDGQLCMQSVLSVDSVLRDLLAEGASDKGIAEIMYHKGTRSLMEDGVAKAFNGLSTLESVFKVTRVVPVVFEALLAATSEAESTHDGEPAKPEPAFHEFHGVADNEPLFRVTSQGKVRTKPFVLVVEDDPDQRAILEMVLRSVDYEVAMAVDGKDALNKIRADRPDLIISDLMMPNMDGKELVSTVKSDPELQSIPVLMLTVVADADKEYELLDMGANDYCDKTVQRKVLLKRVEKLLGRSYA